MKLQDSIKLAFTVLRINKMRTFLTSLGIIIGIGSVILIMSVGAGAQSLIINQLSSMGTNLIAVLPGASEENGPPSAVIGVVITSLKYEDALAIKRVIKSVKAINTYNAGAGTISYGGEKINSNFNGVMSDYLKVEDSDVETGRFFTEEEEKGNAKVVVLGSEVKDNLFNGQDAIGKKIKIKKETFEVIGIMKKRGVVGFENKDMAVLIPVSTAQNIMLGINYVSAIRIKIDSAANLEQSKEEIKLLLRDRHSISNDKIDDFTIGDTKEAIKALTTITNALKFFLVAIAGISLIVGGMGVMNIMLASINERIREIGLRKAVGAKNGNILFQFLLESMSITILGGVVGMILGSVLAYLVAVIAKFLGYNWDFVITPSSIIIGLLVAVFIGFIFGIYPAKRAARFDPIEALRYE